MVAFRLVVVGAFLNTLRPGWVYARQRDKNIRRLLTHVDRATKDSPGAVVSLARVKTFDSEE